ncbi:phytoene desaturase [Candidatus Bathyarchaeota archaeon]|nr:phytoene desaturase [Candidatus Bathyarchaeota archaeon]
MSVLIVGAGVGGLSIAALLADSGKEVTVVEKNSTPGGRARVYRESGYVFDMGPSWYLMPDIYEKYFKDLGLEIEDCYELVRLDPSYRIFFKNREKIDVSSDFEENVELFDRLEESGGDKLRRYLEKAARDYRVAVDELLMRDYDRLVNLLDGRLIREGLKLPLFGNIDDYISSIFSSEKAKRILEYSIGFIGGSPRNTPSIYYIMNHVDLNLGVWYPLGGIGKVVEKLHELCLERGVTFLFDEEVTKVLSEKGKATGVETSRGVYHADMVVINADYPYAEMNLLDGEDRTYDENYWDSKLYSPSAIVIFIGLSKKLDSLEHHNLYLAGDWSLSFDKLYDFDDPELPANTSYYVNATSRTDPSVTPAKGETVFILIPVSDNFQDTAEARDELYHKMVKHIELITGEKIIGYEVVKKIFGPKDFVEDYNAYRGTSLGLVHTLTQSAVFRPSHRSRKLRGLYYTGHYTHPGIGLPLVLISSQILANHLLEKR